MACSRTGWLGPWAVDLLTRPDRPARAANRLGTLAAVACMRTGIDAQLVVDAEDGRLCLPGSGTLAVADSRTILEVRDGCLRVIVAGRRVELRGPAWSPLRIVRAGPLRLLIDDLHPGRDCFALPPAHRLTETTFRRWRQVCAASWQVLSQVVPATGRQVAHGIRVLVPLAAAPHGGGASVTCVNALGAVATTTPEDAIDLAITFVHEWSHSLLNGLLGFVRLHEPAGTRSSSYFAPWRSDPRPLSGLLHGTFAFLAVAETWRALLAQDATAGRAAAEFALLRLQLAEVLTPLTTAPELTEQGRHFVGILRSRHATLMDTPVHPRVVAEATARLDEQRAAWTRHRS